jgi:hypothetical protein
MFLPNSNGESELAAVTASLSSIGLEATKEKWERHWASAVSDEDLEWLVKVARITSVRLPIGFWTLGWAFCGGTAFKDVSNVYEGAWEAVRRLVERLREVGVGVLVDLHGLPGGANKDMHSGTDSGQAELWGRPLLGLGKERRYREVAKRCAVFVAGEVARGRLDGVVGLQIVNEAICGAEGLHEWYRDVINAVGEVDERLPVYISDAWDLGKTMEWVNRRMREGRGRRNPIVVDTHCYYTFGVKDRSQSPQQIIDRVVEDLSNVAPQSGNVFDGRSAQVIVGEWSCVLDGQTWARVEPAAKDNLVRRFGQAQCRQWREKTGGSFFWTWKMDWMDGGEWGIVEMVKKGAVVPPPWTFLSPQEVRAREVQAGLDRENLLAQALGSHVGYWDSTCPGLRFEHHLYAEGWRLGWEDARSFWTARCEGWLGPVALQAGGADRIGCLESWVSIRLLERGNMGKSAWEWEQGFRAGVKAFEGIVAT